MKKLLVILILCLIICGCGNSSKENNLEKIMKEKEYIIVDVRTKEEYEQLHVKGSINIPYDEIDENIDLDKEKNIFVYCKSGNRSSIAYNALDRLGYNVYDLGGISEIDLPKE